ncbi:MAG: hypothetical protein CVV18_04600 [Gammaproteobacteria bacterium HGW-Gammaproteobacteria-8]|nr:MAG: hypothetical protein CVV18_04600 [Gammaproteobacteria bacterium HGW-Gammaproteobacteria-8]
MVEAWLATLEATALARALRASVWVYPLVNAGHILGVGLLVGAIVPLDLRLLGAWRAVPLGPLWQVLTRCAAFGLMLAVGFGALLFITRATEYAASGLFVTKMAVVAAATANALALRVAGLDELWLEGGTQGKLSARVRLAAGISLAGWMTVLILGRLVGYS